MADIVKLKVLEGGNSAAKVDYEPHYFCKRCDGNRFRLAGSGTIYCANVECKARMNNIVVREES